MQKSYAIVILISICFFISSCEQSKLKPSHALLVAAVGLNTGALSDDGEYAIIGSIHHGISLWRLKDEERLYDWNHKANTTTTLIAADFSPDGKWALTADTHTLVLWNVTSGEALRYWSAPGEILSVQLSRNGATALLGLSDNMAVLFDIQKGGILRTLNHNNRVRSVSLANSGKAALTGSEDYSAIFWSLDNATALTKQQHKDDVQLVSLSPDGQMALSVSKYDKAIVWDTETGNIIGEVPLAAERLNRGLRFTSARFSKDNQYLLTGRPDQIVTLWKVDNLTRVTQWKIPKKSAWKPTGAAIVDVAFTAQDKRFVAIASNGFVYTLEQPSK